ncbi:MAG: hypothetical protein K0U34_05955 [Alphaproteobacteria bacterium]|nr:hypothetical protein [Alphaproteobacteria bacterium]
MSKIALGLVGYYQFIRGYPLGPELKERLESQSWPNHQVDLKEMNWGPIAIVQDFQASTIAYDRGILIAAVERGHKPGTVTCRRWVGGKLDVLAVQDRIFEAVTGIISVDNLLVIGEHFQIWPKELIVIEVEVPDDTIGNLVLEELKVDIEAGQITAVGQHPLSPEAEKTVERIVKLSKLAVEQGVEGLEDVVPLSVEDLNPLSKVCHNQLIEDCRLSTPIN